MLLFNKCGFFMVDVFLVEDWGLLMFMLMYGIWMVNGFLNVCFKINIYRFLNVLNWIILFFYLIKSYLGKNIIVILFW